MNKAYGPWGICQYRYDEMDNLISREEKGSKLELTYAEKDSRIKTLKINDIEVPVAYDKLGRMSQKGDMIFAYNERGRLCRINKGKEVLAEIQYNYKNQRVIEKNGDKTKVFVYDDKDRVLGEYGNQGQVDREYIYWEEMPVAFIQDGKLFYYHYDPMNFPVLVTDENGKKVRRVQYLPYGRIASSEGELDNALRFPGQYEIKGVNLYYNLNRTYDFNLGKYIEPDKDFQLDNLYQYCGGNPIFYQDISGLKKNTYYCTDIHFVSVSGSKNGYSAGWLGLRGDVRTDCYEKDGKRYRLVGRFLARFYVGGFSFAPASFGKFSGTFKSRYDIYPYPTMEEFNGQANYLNVFFQFFGALSYGDIILGNVENSGLCFYYASPDVGFTADLDGVSWAVESHEAECMDCDK